MYIKIHETYRQVVALCDADLIGKKFEDDIRQLEIREHFFKGEEISKEQALKRLIELQKNDATFNIVGNKSIKVALEAGIITKENIAKIQNIPFALKLV